MSEFWLAIAAIAVWLLPMLGVVWVLAQSQRRDAQRRRGRMPPRC